MFTVKDFEMMVESTPIGYAFHELLYDENNIPIDCKILAFNPSYLEIIGMKDEDIKNKNLFELFPNLRIEIPELLQLAEDTILYKKHTFIYKFIPSFNKWLKSHFFSTEDHSFTIQFIDLTKEKNLERELTQRSSELEELVNSISDLVIAVKLDGSIIRANQEWERSLGYSVSDLLSRSFYSLLYEEDILSIKEAFETGLIFDPKYLLRSRVLKKDRSWVSVEWKLTFYEDLVYAVGRDITELVKKEDQILYLSYHDKLTGLYNRAFFEEELKRLDNGRNLPLSIILGDVNGLKIINDVFGHLVGDKMLKSIAEILTTSCRKGDIIARWGGDEFIILLPNADNTVTEEIIDRIYNNCKNKELDMHYANISLGYAVKDKESKDMMKLLIDAENNMYQKKLVDGKKVREIIISSMIQYLFDGNYEIKNHIDRIKYYVTALANFLKLSEEDKSKLILLAETHDIGKISIPKKILEKNTELTEFEWNEIKKHPETGFRIAKSIPELSSIGELILYHHERWDGKGYPEGLKGEEIPLLSRIFSIVDVYDSISQDKPHRKALSIGESIDYLRENSGTQFDPLIVNSFINLLL